MSLKDVLYLDSVHISDLIHFQGWRPQHPRPRLCPDFFRANAYVRTDDARADGDEYRFRSDQGEIVMPHRQYSSFQNQESTGNQLHGVFCGSEEVSEPSVLT